MVSLKKVSCGITFTLLILHFFIDLYYKMKRA